MIEKILDLTSNVFEIIAYFGGFTFGMAILISIFTGEVHLNIGGN